MEIANKAAVVSGGASGLGRACVQLLVQAGARVAVLDLNADDARTIFNSPNDAAKQVLFIKTDVSDDGSVKKAVEQAAQTFGAIHLAINCAGIGFPQKVLGTEGLMSMDLFEKTMKVNLFGTLNVIRHAASKMVENEANADGEKGVIINTSSIAAYEGQVGQVAYTASKAAIIGITLPVAREFADYGIRVATIAPGIFDTPLLGRLSEKVKVSLARQIPFPKRLGNPEEFAALARHIIENPMINGETIRLDGGLRMAEK
jgi:3-hydroxyacyl-CoA dehydrogenase/3-hydroxy-2-methylbutyryl-CoA dehydrogenase